MPSDLVGTEKCSTQQVVPRPYATNQERGGTHRYQTLRRQTERLSQGLSVSHWLSISVVIVNIAVIVSLLLRKDLLDDPQMCFNGLAGTLLICVAIRQEDVLNLLYYVFGLIPHSTPLCIRKHAAHLYHLGGIHRGAAFAASIWIVFFNIAAAKLLASTTVLNAADVSTMVMAAVLDLLILILMTFSFSAFRESHHDLWESMHRFSGWLALLVFWAYLVVHVTLLRLSKQTTPPAWRDLIWGNPSFYYLITLTICVASSWMPGLRLKRTTPRYEKFSDHAIQLHFDGWYVGPCKTRRFATSRCRDWHAFACIAYPNGHGHSIIISRAGDWTSKIIETPPEQLWNRGTPVQGAVYMAKLFKTVLCVSTGSGIAPILALLEIPGTKFRILWSTRDPKTHYSKEIVERVYRADADAVVFDRAVDGRPDLVQCAAEIYHAGDIEAIFVVSNAEVTRQIVRDLRTQNLPAYGPVFDS